MTQRMVCPKCKESFYANDIKIYGPCPYCGFVVNRKSLDRRVFERTKKDVPITLELEGEVRTAEIKDISKMGAGIFIPNPPFVKRGDRIRCKIGENDEMRDTKVVWSEEGKDTQRVGLLFI